MGHKLNNIKSEQAERASEGDHEQLKGQEHQSDGQKSLGPCVESTLQHLNTGVWQRGEQAERFFSPVMLGLLCPSLTLKKQRKKKTYLSLCAVPFATHKVLVLSLVKYLD